MSELNLRYHLLFITVSNAWLPLASNSAADYYSKMKIKIAAGMQHTPPRDIFNAKKITLKKIQWNKKNAKDREWKQISNVNQGL